VGFAVHYKTDIPGKEEPSLSAQGVYQGWGKIKPPPRQSSIPIPVNIGVSVGPHRTQPKTTRQLNIPLSSFFRENT